MHPLIKRLRGPLLSGLPLAAALSVASAAPQQPAPQAPKTDPAGIEFYEKKVRPLLAAACYPCHGGGRASGGLSLDSREGWEKGGGRGPAVVPGKPDASLLLKAVLRTDSNLVMPPGGAKLSDAQIGILRTWIIMGAPAPVPTSTPAGTPKLTGMTATAKAHWSFQPVIKPTVPSVKNAAWVKNPIDAFVLAKLEANRMKPNPPAPRESLIRRATYDLLGLPPTVEEVRAFLADRSPNAWSKVVDRLLASPHYGERWGRHWLDTARYSDTRGLLINNGKNAAQDYRYAYAWTYRDYVIRAMNEDKPYNQFLMEQIAADKLPGITPNDPRLAALGFLTVGKRFVNPDDEIDERIDTLTKSTLGLTVSCARCHDHKFDPIPQADYYSLHGIFASTLEPAEKPAIAGESNGDPAQRADYDAKLAALEAEDRDVYYEIVGERLDEFQQHAEGYLMLASVPPKSPERADIAEKYGISAYESRDMIGALPRQPNHPVLGPFIAVLRIPAAQFATNAPVVLSRVLANRRFTVNPRVALALRNLRPRTLAEVARAYGPLFAEARQHTAEYLKARAGGPAANVDASMAEIIETPFAIPPAAQIATTEKLMPFVAKLPQRGAGGRQINARFRFAAINELRLTHPGAPPAAMVVADSDDPKDSYVYLRGDRARKGPVVPRRFLEICSPATSERPTFENGSGRLELAKAIVAPGNPLTARVLVNRVWMHHFGEGFVRTVDDLGNQSEKPSHPELIDWLASTFMENGWSLKKLHRLILLSNTYQESSAPNPTYAATDPANRLLWRANLRRLDFESIRDSMVLLTGKMDPTLYGKPVNLTDEPYSYRRSVYGYVDRLFLSDLMTQFDYPDPDMTNSRRTSTIVPQQALFFLNSPMAVDVARQVTARPEVMDAPDDAARVKAIYLALFQRSPRPEEVAWAKEFVAAAAKTVGVATMQEKRQRMQADRRAQQLAAQRRRQSQGNKYAAVQNAGTPVERGPLTPWELYAQALLCSNEFVYVN